MQDLLEKHSDPKTACSMAPSIDGNLSWWTATESQTQRSSITRNLSFKMATPIKCSQSIKQLGFQFQDKDSSSTQSTGQSFAEASSVETNDGKNVLSIQSGSIIQGENDDVLIYTVTSPSNPPPSVPVSRPPITQTYISRTRPFDLAFETVVAPIMDPPSSCFDEPVSSPSDPTPSDDLHVALRKDMYFSASSGCSRIQAKLEEDHSRPAMSFQDSVLPHSPFDHRQYACFPFPYPDPCHRGLLNVYGPYPVVHSPMMGMKPTRVPLPLKAMQDEPVYVNAKQYRAILRRRQFRAKLEAQNKISKVRKPYLHESRHRHALNRARGSGGRFLNTKKPQEPNGSSKTNDQDISGSMQLQLNTEAMDSEVHQQVNGKGGNSMIACSEITSASKGDSIFYPPEFRFSVYQSHTGTLAAGGGCTTGDLQQYLSVLQ